MTDDKLSSLRKKLARKVVSYREVAADAGVSWSMVWKVLHGQRTSAKVLQSALKLSA